MNMVKTQDYYSQTLIVQRMKLRNEEVYKDFSNDKEMFDFSNFSTKPKYYDKQNSGW